MIVTVKDVEYEVKEIRRYTGGERMGYEHSLFLEVLRAIADGDCEDPAALAQAAFAVWP